MFEQERLALHTRDGLNGSTSKPIFTQLRIGIAIVTICVALFISLNVSGIAYPFIVGIIGFGYIIYDWKFKKGSPVEKKHDINPYTMDSLITSRPDNFQGFDIGDDSFHDQSEQKSETSSYVIIPEKKEHWLIRNIKDVMHDDITWLAGEMKTKKRLIVKDKEDYNKFVDLAYGRR